MGVNHRGLNRRVVLRLTSALVVGVLAAGRAIRVVRPPRLSAAPANGAFVLAQDGSAWVVHNGVRYSITFTPDDDNILPALREGRSLATAFELTAALATAPGPDDTPVDAVLELRQTWRQDGLALTLNEFRNGVTAVDITFRLVNMRDQETTFQFTDNQTFSIIDNRGRTFRMTSDRVHRFTLRPGESIHLPRGWTVFIFAGDVGARDVTELVVTVSGISTITNARWRIPIYH